MEKAKQKALEIASEHFSTENRDKNELKPEINNLLHMFLPDDVTMKEAEILALLINDIIWHPYDYLPKGAAKS